MLDLESVTLKGVVKKIIYRNAENDFIVAQLLCEDNNTVTLVGNSFNLNQGEKVIVTGKWKENKKYGLQLEIENLDVFLPTTKEGIEKFLGSGLIKGIGPITAKKIVEKFGLKSLDIIDKTPDRLTEIEGLAAKKLEIIKNEWAKQQYIREIIIFMQSCGISNTFAIKIFNTYGNNSIKILKTNPYKLIEDVIGIGFKTADSIAEKLGIAKESDFRIRAGIIYLLNEITESGHCYYPLEELINLAVNLLQVENSIILKAINDLIILNKIYVDENKEKVYLKNIYEYEKIVAKKLLEIKNSKKIPIIDNFIGKNSAECKNNINTNNNNTNNTNNNFKEIHSEEITRQVQEIADKNNIELDENQLEAVKSAVNENVFIITGSPGTGKSTILKIIIDFFKKHQKSVLLAAPTGRAAKRLSEATGYDAKTIHRLLKYQPKINKFQVNENNKLNADLIVLDEASMIDIRLFKSLISAISENTRIIIVGDADQLPAVGPGNVLADIINSQSFKVIKLKKIYRQEGQSKIIYNAHRIRDGLFPSIKNSEFKDFYFIEETNPELVIKTIVDMITNRIPNNFNLDPLKDIQVIVPTNKGVVGSNNLNLKIQEQINKSDVFIMRGNTCFKLNDRVIQLKNNYDKEVFNGDIGFIKNIDFEMKELTIDFDERLICYDFFDTDQLNLSYAISIHKSQGSEFRCVIIPILTSHYMLLQRNLLYTAITRAKEIAVLIGSKKAIGIAVNKNIVEERFTTLKELLSS